MARTRQQLTKLENWFLDHPLQSTTEYVKGYEIFYTDKHLYMYPVNQRHLLERAPWDYEKGPRASAVILGLHMKVANKILLQQTDDAEAITDNQPDEPAPWDTFDWSI